MKPVKSLVTLLLLLIPYIANGQSNIGIHQSHEDILAAARQHLMEQTSHSSGKVKIKVNPLDHRLKLIRCELPLETFSPSNSRNQGKATVGVKCSSPKPWTLYVMANIGIEGPVVIARRDLSRGTAISADDIQLLTKDTSHLLRGHFETITQVLGRTLKRDLRRNRVVTPSLLVVQKTISRGQMVTILAGHSGIEVRMKGKALRNGNPGELIPVQNLSSKKKLEARVVSAGNVRIE